MKTAFESNLYFAKATFPVGNPWRSGWTTKTEAARQAEKFCDDWRDIGIIAEATVFYRDGSAVQHFSSRETILRWQEDHRDVVRDNIAKD